MKKTLPFWSLLLAFVLTNAAAVAQTVPPVLSTPPVAAPPAVPALPNDKTPGELLGRRYDVELQSGTSFSGVLRAANAEELEFETTDLGVMKVPRANVKRLAMLTGKHNYFDIGNGNRIFFAPTGRGLRQGEGSLQVVSLFLVGANYGVNQYISVGGYVSLIPGFGINQLLVLTPKITLPVSERFGVGAGVLYLRIPTFGFNSNGRQSFGAGILYGTATYGSADNNFTAGLGYGFFEQEIGSEPVFQFGGQTRVSRRLSLLSENYLINEVVMGGLYGVKINWPRTSFGVAAAYRLNFSAANDVGSGTGIIPVYYDFTYRFGKTGR